MITKWIFKINCWFWLLCLGFSAQAQSFEISGNVIDENTGEPVPFANISIKDVYKGTASNALGEFSFKVDSLPVNLVITHLSYESKEMEVASQLPFRIGLAPGKLLMDEVMITEKGNDEYAYKLIEKAFDVITRNKGGDQYGKAFYRQISKNGDEYSELYEIFYDTRFNLNGVDDWAIQEGRYALKLSTADSFIYNKNFTLMVRLLSIVQPKTDDLVMPVSRQIRDQYEVRVARMMSVNNRKVAEISFAIKEEVTKPAMEGMLYIDIDSYEVLKLKGTVANDELKFISLRGKSGSWQNYNVSCEIAFKPMEDGRLALDYMQLGQKFDYYYDGTFTNVVETESFFSFYEYYTPPKRKKLGGRLLRFNARDSELLDNVGYNQKFWDDNIIVKRTPVESKVIASFEADRAFGSIYLNNTDQIILEDYKLDADPFIVRVKEQLQGLEPLRAGHKLYLHHDKPFYAAGEKIRFKAYLVNMATNIPDGNDDAAEVEIHSPDGLVVGAGKYAIQHGSGHGEIEIPDTLQSGVYVLSASTNEMAEGNRGFGFYDQINIYNPKDASGQMNVAMIDSINSLQYFPEGGKLIESMPGQLGIAATDRFGNGLDVKGRILDGFGRSIATIENDVNGLGSIFLSPKSDVKYRTMIMSAEVGETRFPEISKNGYSIMVNIFKPNTLDVAIKGTPNFEGRKFYLLVLSNGMMLERRVGTLTRGVFRTEIPKANLPTGIAQILLVDDEEMIRCRRNVFVKQPEEATVKYYLANKDFRQGERIDMVLEFDNENGKPLADANFSIAVLDMDRMSRKANDRNINSYLNLGYISDRTFTEEGLLVESDDKEILKKMDLAMLTQQTIFPKIESFNKPINESNASSFQESSSNHNYGMEKIDIPGEGKNYLDVVQKNGIDQMPADGQQSENSNQQTTVYWNPDIKTNKRGRAKISFYNSESARNLQICIEGITEDGLPIFDIYEIGRNAKRK